jgi:uncharacterized protein YndB with AHSA1/START domain
MAPITTSIEINRPAEDVFAYMTDLARHREWQGDILETTVLTEGPTRVGSRARDRRRVPGTTRDLTYEITEFEPPRRVRFQGIDSPVRVQGEARVEPLDEGRSRVTLSLDFKGRGVGLLLAPMVRRQAARAVPVDYSRLKEQLESGAA